MGLSRSSVLSLYTSFRRRQSSVRNQGLDGRPAIRIDHQFERGRTFRTKAAAAHGAVGVALDIDHPAVFDVDALPAANGAIGADAAKHLRVMDARLQVFTPLTQWIGNESNMCVEQ